MGRLLSRARDTGRPTTPEECRRSLRVRMLLVVIVVLSLADLYITLLFLHSGGMGEANPIALAVMRQGSPGLVVAFKCVPLTIASLILLWARRHRVAELACWCCALVLTALTMHWSAYAEEASKIRMPVELAAVEGTRWVEIER